MVEEISKYVEVGRKANDYALGNSRYSVGKTCKRCGGQRRVARKCANTGKTYQYCQRCEKQRHARKNRQQQKKQYPPLRLPESKKTEQWSYEDYDI